MIFKSYNILGLCCSSIAVLLSFSVFYGWYTSNQSLVQIYPSFAPMQFNTALGFAFSGLGVISIQFGLLRLSQLLGLIVLVLGALTLTQYWVDVDYGIDNLFVDPVYLTKTSHPGRMAPSTAICFSILGLILLSATYARAFVLSASIAIFVLSTLSLMGYFYENENLYGWGSLTRMAIHTAVCFILLTFGHLLYFFSNVKEEQFDVWQFVPLMVLITVSVLTFFAWYVIKEEARARDKANFQSLVDKTEDALLDRYVLYEEALRGGLGLFYASDTMVRRDQWKKYVEALELASFLPSINGMGYIDFVLEDDLNNYLNTVRKDNIANFKNHPETEFEDKFIIKYIEPVERNKEAIGLDIGFEANRREAAERSRDEAKPVLTKKISLVQDHKKEAGFLLLIPVYDIKAAPNSLEARRKNIQGWVYAPFIASSFFYDANGINNGQLTFKVYDGNILTNDNIIYSNISSNLKLNPQAKNENKTSFTIAERMWTLVWYRSPNYKSPSNYYFADILLVLGLLLAFLLYVTLHRLLNSRSIISKKVEIRTRELLEAQASLLQANEELEEFSYRTSHDLRSPLVSSISLLGLTKAAIKTNDKKTALEGIKHIEGSLIKLEILVKDILALTQTKNAEEDEEKINIEELIDEALKKFENMDNFKCVSIIKKLDYNESFSTKKSRLVLIIENLISNAIKYQDTEKDKAFIKISTYEENNSFVLEVKDNGLGIPKEQQDKMFQMFKRFHNRIAFGSGLGLYMMKKSAQIIGGDIFYQDINDGSIFKLVIKK